MLLPGSTTPDAVFKFNTTETSSLKFYYPSIRKSAPSNESAEGLRRRRFDGIRINHNRSHLGGLLPVRLLRLVVLQHEHRDVFYGHRAYVRPSELRARLVIGVNNTFQVLNNDSQSGGVPHSLTAKSCATAGQPCPFDTGVIGYNVTKGPFTITTPGT
jgi:hypothetical protein